MTIEEFKNVFLIVGPLIGVIIGGLITTVAKVIELHYTKKRDSERIRLERLESIYQHTNYIFSKSNRLFHYLGEPGRDIASAETRIEFNKYLDEVSELNAKTHAIHNLYLAEAGKEWDRFGKAMSEYSQAAADLQRKTGTYAELDSKLDVFHTKLTDYQVALISVGRHLTKVGVKEANEYRRKLLEESE